jgi:hypothetical protein
MSAPLVDEPYEHDPYSPRTECPGEVCPECRVCPVCSIDGHVEGCSREGEEYTRVPWVDLLIEPLDRPIVTLAVSDVL